MDEQDYKNLITVYQNKYSDIINQTIALESRELKYRQTIEFLSNTNKELLQLSEKIVIQFRLVIIEKFKKGKRFKLTAKGSAITAWSMIHGIALTLNNNKKENLESLWHIELENILGEMSAIWGKGVSEK